jgi:hypothetical protein
VKRATDEGQTVTERPPVDQESLSAGGQDNPHADSITLSSLLERIVYSIGSDESAEAVAKLAENGNSNKRTVAGEQTQLGGLKIAWPYTFAYLCEILNKKSSSRLADWVSKASGGNPASYGLARTVGSETFTLDALADAALEASLGTSLIAHDGDIAEKPETGAAYEEKFATAMDHLAVTLSSFENRITGTGLVKTSEQVNSGEILWLEEAELASKLEKILKRQARRRGIDLS